MSNAASQESSVRLQVILSRAGFSSRRGASELLEQGLVTVNGKVIREPGFRVDPRKDDVRVRGQSVELKNSKTNHRYFLFYKPAGVTTTLSDPHAKRSLKDFLRDIPGRVYPVGRLDRDTTGLLLLTDDGELAFRLAHPKYGVEKTYEVRVRGIVSEKTIKKLTAGVLLDDGESAPCGASIKKIIPGEPASSGGTTDLILRLHEGRKRQIRRMCDAVGFPVIALHRSGYADLSLKGLSEGQKRPLTAPEVASLKQQVCLA